jgi:hypothetical protein
MTVRKICVDEVTTLNETYSETVTCTDPSHTPIDAGDECRVHVYNENINLNNNTLSFSFEAEFEYEYETSAGATFTDDCIISDQSDSLTIPSGVNLCCGATTPNINTAVSCDSTAITTTTTSVSGPVFVSFSIDNLCVPTIICVDDTTCT